MNRSGMYHPLRCLCAALLLVVLAACGGGASAPTRGPDIPGPGAPGDQAPRTVSGLRGAALDLLDVWVPSGVATYTSVATVPTTGSATYGGFLYGDLSDGDAEVLESVVGRLTLEVTFTAGDPDFDGVARDFVDSRDAPLSGTLAVSGGALNRNGNPANDATLRGVSVAGTLRDGAGTDMVFGVQLEGDFLGTRVDAIGGEAIGRVSVGRTTQDFDGGFIAAE